MSKEIVMIGGGADGAAGSCPKPAGNPERCLLRAAQKIAASGRAGAAS